MEWAKTKEVPGLIRYCTIIIDVIFNFSCNQNSDVPTHKYLACLFSTQFESLVRVKHLFRLDLLPQLTCSITFSTRSARVTIYDFFHLFILSNIFRIHSSVRSIRTKRQQIPDIVDENFSRICFFAEREFDCLSNFQFLSLIVCFSRSFEKTCYYTSP